MSAKLFPFVSGTQNITNTAPQNEFIENINITPLIPNSSIVESRYLEMMKANTQESIKQNVYT